MSNTTYPGSKDSFTNPSATDTLASVSHYLQHGLANDALLALETKLGTGSSNQLASTGSILVGTGSGATEWVDTLTSPSITTSLLDSNNNTWIEETAVASAVNYIVIGNNSTGNAPSTGSAGSDTNVDYNLTTQGSGVVRDNGSSLLGFRSSFANFIATGLAWSTGSGLAGSMTSGNIWINGVEYSVSAISSHTFGASVDTYVDYTAGTGIVYNAVSNGAASPSLAANSIRIAKVVTGASSISSITQNPANDSLGNPIGPIGPVGVDTLSIGAQSAYVASTETTASTSYADLATTTDSVIVMVGNNGILDISFYANMYNSTTNNNFVTVQLSGANSFTASDSTAITSYGTAQNGFSISFQLNGLTAGATTVKMKYRVSGGTGTFLYRRLKVIPL